MSKNNRYNVNLNKTSGRRKCSWAGVIPAFVIMCAVILIFFKVALPMIKEKAADVVAEKTVDIITDNVDKIAGDNPEVKKVIENMSEEDKETVTKIVAEHIDAETATEIMGYVNDKDKAGLVEYATENLSPEEISELMYIYGKYAGDISE